MKRLSKNATIVFRYLYKNADHSFPITEIYNRLGLLSGDEKDVVKELSGLGLIHTESDSRENLLYGISEYGKRVYES